MNKLILFLAAFSSIYLSAQNVCKDTVFNVDKSQYLCLTNVYGEWKLDSVAADSSYANMDNEVWSFQPGAYYMRTHNKNKNPYKETGKYKFIKGYMELSDLVFEGGRVLSKLGYKVVAVSKTRLVLQYANAGVQIIFKKIK